jgi:hypothetical protein
LDRDYARVVATIAGFVWTLPNTVLGTVIGLLTFHLPRLSSGVLLFDRGPRGVSAILSRLGRTAMTVGFVVIGTEPVRGELLRHELVHVRQYRVWGPLFLPLYGALYLRYGYDRHPFELAASRGAGP